MRILILAFLLFSSLANAEGFFSGEPDESDLRGAVHRAAIKHLANQPVTLHMGKFQKIDCTKQSPKIYRCTYLVQFNITSNFAAGIGSDNQTVTDSNTFTKLNGQWTTLGGL